MPGKRKRTAHPASTSASRKKRKRALSDAPAGIDPHVYYSARSILAETATKYLIDWADHPTTGEQYQPTWEPKRNANQAAVDDWKAQKAGRQAGNKAAPRSKTGQPSTTSAAPSSDPDPQSEALRQAEATPEPVPAPVPARTRHAGRPRKASTTDSVAPPSATAPKPAPNRPRARNRKVIPSSTPSAEESRSAEVARSPSEGKQRWGEAPLSVLEPEIDESQQTASGAEKGAESSLFAPGDDHSTRKTAESAVLQPPHPPSSSAAGACERIAEKRSGTSAEPSQPGSAATSSAPQPRTEVLQCSENERPAGSSSAPTPGPATQRSSTQESSAESLPKVIPDSQSQQDISGLIGTHQSGSESQQVLDGDLGTVQPSDIIAESSGAAVAEQELIEPVSQQQDSRDQAQARAPQDASRSAAVLSDEPSVQLREELADDLGTDLQRAQAAQEHCIDPPVSQAPTEDPSGLEPLAGPITHRQDHIDTSTSPGTRLEPSKHSPRNAVVISSSEDHSWKSGKLISSFQSKSRPQTADFEPPPAGQRLPHSSLTNRTSQHNRHQGVSPVSPVRYSSSFPFQTQVPTTDQRIVPPDLPHSPGARALFRSQLTITTPSKAPSVLSHCSALSSPFPSLPSQSLRTLGESAPQPFNPFTPSGSPAKSIMDSSSKRERISFAAELKAKRDQRKASSRRSFTPLPIASMNSERPASALPLDVRNEVAASQADAQVERLGSPLAPLLEGVRSPSMVPAVEPVPGTTKEEMNTSERYETLLPQAQEQGESGRTTNGTSTGHGVPRPPRAPNEDPEMVNVFAVPVAPSPMQRDQYQENIYYEHELIRNFLDDPNPSTKLVAEADKFLERLRNIAMHPDLINPETLSQTAEAERQAKWDIKCSAKFHFLNEFLEHMRRRERNLHLAVVAKGERLPGMVQNFLNGMHVLNRRLVRPLADGSDFQASSVGSKVSVIDLDADLNPESVQPADVVIALDASVDAKTPLIRALRKRTGTVKMTETTSWALLLTLVVPRTVDHMELCLQKAPSTSVTTRMLMKATKELRFESGRREVTQAPVKEAAAAIAEYIDDIDAHEWPLAGPSQLEELDSQTETDVEMPASNATDTPAPAKRPHGEMEVDSDPVKRPHEEMEVDSDPAKRARHQSPEATDSRTTINPLDIESTHVSESPEKGGPPDLDPAPSQDHSLSVGATERRLRDLLQGAQDRLDEHIKALEELQYRHEDQRKKLVEVTRERDNAVNAAAVAVQRLTGSEANNASLRAERTQLKDALAEANKSLLSHTVPERAELEQLRLLMEQAKVDKDKAEKRADTTQKDLEWTRSMYQDTSSKAIELTNQNRDLEDRLAVALRKAQGDAARARGISVQGHNKMLERANSQLRVMLEIREAALKFKDKEISRLKDSGRGRMGTRQSSQPPRSPELGSPIKGRASRAESPAAGDLGTRGKTQHLHPPRQSGSKLSSSPPK